MYALKKMMCAPVIHTLLTMPTIRPCRKNLAGAKRAMRYAQTMKMTSQKSGSIFDGMTKTVAMAIANPKRESAKTSFQFTAGPVTYQLTGRSSSYREETSALV